jgi:hypothetical protein
VERWRFERKKLLIFLCSVEWEISSFP